MSDYLDEHPEEVKNAGYYRRQLKLVQTKLAAKDDELQSVKAENDRIRFYSNKLENALQALLVLNSIFPTRK